MLQLLYQPMTDILDQCEKWLLAVDRGLNEGDKRFKKVRELASLIRRIPSSLEDAAERDQRLNTL